MVFPTDSLPYLVLASSVDTVDFEAIVKFAGPLARKYRFSPQLGREHCVVRSLDHALAFDLLCDILVI